MGDDWDDNAVQSQSWNSAGGSHGADASNDSGQRRDNRSRDGGGYGGSGGYNRDSNREYRPRTEFSRNNRDGGGGGGGGRDGGNRGFNRDGGGGGGGGFRGGDRGGDENFEVLNVPSRFVGRVIGRGGSKINELQAESGARIQVTKDTDGDDTIVKLFGDEASISEAKSLINELITVYSR